MFKRTQMGFHVPIRDGADYMDLHEMAEELTKLIPNGTVTIDPCKTDFCMVRIEIEKSSD